MEFADEFFQVLLGQAVDLDSNMVGQGPGEQIEEDDFVMESASRVGVRPGLPGDEVHIVADDDIDALVKVMAESGLILPMVVLEFVFIEDIIAILHEEIIRGMNADGESVCRQGFSKATGQS